VNAQKEPSRLASVRANFVSGMDMLHGHCDTKVGGVRKVVARSDLTAFSLSSRGSYEAQQKSNVMTFLHRKCWAPAARRGSSSAKGKIPPLPLGIASYTTCTVLIILVAGDKFPYMVYI